MDSETRERIEETVLQILKSSNMDETTEYKVRQTAAEMLGLDLSPPERKRLVRQVVETYLSEQQSKDEPEPEEEKEEEEDEEEERKRKRGGAKEYDDDGDLIICQLSKSRRVTIQEFRGKTLVSMREYYRRDGKDLPTAKGISLTAEQWSSFSKNVPAIEKAIRKMESRLN
ncbi:RNA polymerase II transcriptional coactivator KELP like [Actinidia chinensis var. chinensis]|uniref:RNA polymerase II transcriptional coactivator KELP like n=1 Tax=Actinidia chinensis var. chinensis TaxID=1590841 RepID=A0A2R6QN07_ACTCC|nr:RNA polymerase II transcriptional coactivator KELP like [Actinidia chinensis var. chinensis]